jgi:hypothetical protein
MSKKISSLEELTQDTIIPNQQFVCLSLLPFDSSKTMNNEVLNAAIKIRGCYATKEEAIERCKYLQQVDDEFHIFLGEVGKWMDLHPNINNIEEQVYKNRQLNELMQSYRQNMKDHNDAELKRQFDLKNANKNNDDNDNDKEILDSKNRLKEKLFNNNNININNINNINNNDDNDNIDNIDNININNNINDIDNNDDKLELINNDKQQQHQTQKNIDDKLNELQQIYNKL